MKTNFARLASYIPTIAGILTIMKGFGAERFYPTTNPWFIPAIISAIALPIYLVILMIAKNIKRINAASGSTIL